MRWVLYLFVTSLLIFSSSAFALKEYYSLTKSIRSLGMGGAILQCKVKTCAAGRIVLGISEMRYKLGLQRRLEHHLDDGGQPVDLTGAPTVTNPTDTGFSGGSALYSQREHAPRPPFRRLLDLPSAVWKETAATRITRFG